MRRYYDRYQQRSDGGLVSRILFFVVLIGVIFLFRNSILGWLQANPEVNRYVPGVVTSALERDLEDWRQEDLRARVEQLKAEVTLWQNKLEDAATQGQEKLAEVQENLNQAREALAETKAALDKLTAAGENLKNVVTPGEEAGD